MNTNTRSASGSDNEQAAVRLGGNRNDRSVLGNDQRGVVLASLVSVVLGIIFIMLGLRFVFRFFGADPANEVAHFVYAITQPLVAPFTGLFRAQEAVESMPSLEVPTLVAMLVYGFAAAVLNGILSAGRHHSVR
jgi:uncharacterized protein YggT (Ycf19 family)